ncbi:MAG: glycosyltransferase, partial [Coriobacteriales bacterium]|nr:glycosyltransferase [Coriobacteriales bacterium]
MKSTDIAGPSSQEIAVTLECQDNAREASPQPLRVLVFCEKWESGGVEAFVTTLLECMDRTGLVVDVAACKVQPGPYDIRLAKMGIEPIALGTSIRSVASNLKEFRRLLEQGAYDAVHLNVYEGLALLFAREAKRAGVARVIVHSHNNDLRPSATRWLKLALHRMCTCLLGGYADVRWAPSQAAGRFMFDKRPFVLVRNGVVVERFAFDADVREGLRFELGFTSDQTVLGCVGRLCEQKNQLFLVEVLAALPKDACLLLVGEDDGDGSYEVALRRRVRELGVQERVRLYGRTSDVAPLYQAMDVLCVPSTFEALGIVAVEGQAAGLPVVASTAVPPEAHAGGRFNQAQLDPDVWASALTDALAQHHDRSQ